MQKACNMSHLIIITCVLSLPQLIHTHSSKKATCDCQCLSSIGDCGRNSESESVWMRTKLSSKRDQRVLNQQLPYNFNFDASFWGGGNLVNARIKQITLLTPHLPASMCESYSNTESWNGSKHFNISPDEWNQWLWIRIAIQMSSETLSVGTRVFYVSDLPAWNQSPVFWGKPWKS